MAEDHANFVKSMLEGIKEKKKEIKPQTRVEGVNREEIAKMTENLIDLGGKTNLIKSKKR